MKQTNRDVVGSVSVRNTLVFRTENDCFDKVNFILKITSAKKYRTETKKKKKICISSLGPFYRNGRRFRLKNANNNVPPLPQTPRAGRYPAAIVVIYRTRRRRPIGIIGGTRGHGTTTCMCARTAAAAEDA